MRVLVSTIVLIPHDRTKFLQCYRKAFTAEDVTFSFDRYQGAGATELKKQVKAIEIIHPHHIRFVLHAPWLDFLTFYATPATGAGWIVPKNYTGIV